VPQCLICSEKIDLPRGAVDHVSNRLLVSVTAPKTPVCVTNDGRVVDDDLIAVFTGEDLDFADAVEVAIGARAAIEGSAVFWSG